MTDPTDALLSRDDVVGRIRRGEISSLALTERYLARIEDEGSPVHAFVTVTADLARAQASAADDALARAERLGALHGLPVAIKDNIDLAGTRTTMGSRFFADNIPARDAEAARRLREAGAVILGKTAMHEFAYGGTTQNPHFGACRNPWDLERIPGGSSGGSGAALAADLCAAALGTDTGGSVRIPAALNGASALRPTTGRISNTGVFPITWTFDTVGPMAHCVADVATLYATLAGYDPADPLSRDVAVDAPLANLEAGVEGLRVGFPERFYLEDVDDEVATCVRAAADVLATLGAEVVPVDLPGAEDAMEITTRIIRAEALAIHRRRLEEQADVFGDDVRRRLALGHEISGADYAALRQRARVWQRTVEDVFSRIDLVLTPATGTVAPRAEDAETIETTRRLTRLTYGWSLAAVPVLAVPCGASARGLPVGMQLAAAPWRETTLLRAGHAYQRETDWHLRRPAAIDTPHDPTRRRTG